MDMCLLNDKKTNHVIKGSFSSWTNRFGYLDFWNLNVSENEQVIVTKFHNFRTYSIESCYNKKSIIACSHF